MNHPAVSGMRRLPRAGLKELISVRASRENDQHESRSFGRAKKWRMFLDGSQTCVYVGYMNLHVKERGAGALRKEAEVANVA